jgi:hypothetical protein
MIALGMNSQHLKGAQRDQVNNAAKQRDVTLSSPR